MSAPFQQPAPPPAPPTPPAPVAGPARNVLYAGPGGAISTTEDLANLRARRSELSDQLENASSRRRQLVEQLRRADGVNKAGLESRVAVLDQRIVRLESELDATGQLLTTPEAARLIAETRPPKNFDPPIRFRNVDPEPILISFTLFVLAPISLAISRIIWKRASRVGATVPALADESGQRLERIEQAMDAIAIEVERVSEGQRFVTRLLSERHGGALGAAQSAPEAMRVPVGDPSRVR
jgi:hypothetical protein